MRGGGLAAAASLLMIGVLSGCSAAVVPTTTPGATRAPRPAAPAPIGAAGHYASVFDDEFDGDHLDLKRWSPVWFNESTQLNGGFTDPQNVSVGGGTLKLTVSSPTAGAEVSTSPGMDLGGDPGFTFLTGYYLESRIWFPAAADGSVANFPAFWTSSYDWPRSGEADVFEGVQGAATTNYHYADEAGQHATIGSTAIPGTWTGGWHVFGLYRAATYDEVYWDGKQVATYPTHDGGAKWFLVLNNGPGEHPVIGPDGTMLVDYVRAWRRTD